MAIYEYVCWDCEELHERILSIKEMEEGGQFCPKCYKEMHKIPSRCSFKLNYNSKTDMVDWNGNRSRYWDEYNKQKAEGKNVRIPEEDGDPR